LRFEGQGFRDRVEGRGIRVKVECGGMTDDRLGLRVEGLGFDVEG